MLTVVTGPPCSGKSTYARQRAEPGHILVDYDLLAQALGSTAAHDHPDAVRWVAIAARRAAVNAAIAQHHRGATVWIVHTRIPANDMQRYLGAGAEIVTLTADPAELHARADRERPADWHRLIDEWKPVADPRPARAPKLPDANARRGHWGRPWRRVRAQVLAASRTCWICGHDGSDSVDHLTPVSRGGAPLDLGNLAPAHHAPCPTCGRRCNAVRGVAVGRGVTDGDGGAGAHRAGPSVAPMAVSTHTW